MAVVAVPGNTTHAGHTAARTRTHASHHRPNPTCHAHMPPSEGAEPLIRTRIMRKAACARSSAGLLWEGDNTHRRSAHRNVSVHARG